MESLYKITFKDLVLYTSFVIFLAFVTTKILFENYVGNTDFDLKGADFRAYYTAGTLVKNGQISKLYDKEAQYELHQQIINEAFPTIWFLNTPVTAALFAPLALLSFEQAYYLFAIINALLVFFSVVLITRNLGINYKATAILALYFPIMSAIYHNQITLIVLFIYAGIIAFIKKDVFVAGIFGGLLLIKPQHIIFLPLIAATLPNLLDLKKFAFGAAVSAGIIFVANIGLYGPNIYGDYIAFLANRREGLVQLEKYESFNIHSLAILMDPVLGITTSARILTILQITLYLTALIIMFKNRFRVEHNYLITAAIIFALTLNIHTKYTDLVILLIPILLLLQQITRNNTERLSFNNHAMLIMLFILLRQTFTGVVAPFIPHTILLIIAGFILLKKEARETKA